MPANLTQQYLKAEEEFRRAATPDEQLNCLQTMLRELPKHKGTDKLQAELKQRISKVRKEIQSESKSPSRKGHGVRIPPQGAGTVILVGGPNSGKSQLLARLTRATPEVAPYPFTTHNPAPGMMTWEDVMIQLIDTPPVTKDYFESYMHGLIRGADLVLFVVDLGDDDGIEQCQAVLDKLNSTKTRLATTSYLDENDIGLSYTQTFLIANKCDVTGAEDRRQLLQELCSLEFREIIVSAETGDGLDTLRKAVFEKLDIVRVYSKSPGQKEPDLERPFTVRRGATLLEVAELVHKDFVNDFKFARVWGSQVHDGTVVKEDYIVQDRDIVELHQ